MSNDRSECENDSTWVLLTPPAEGFIGQGDSEGSRQSRGWFSGLWTAGGGAAHDNKSISLPACRVRELHDMLVLQVQRKGVVVKLLQSRHGALVRVGSWNLAPRSFAWVKEASLCCY